MKWFFKIVSLPHWKPCNETYDGYCTCSIQNVYECSSACCVSTSIRLYAFSLNANIDSRFTRPLPLIQRERLKERRKQFISTFFQYFCLLFVRFFWRVFSYFLWCAWMCVCDRVYVSVYIRVCVSLCCVSVYCAFIDENVCFRNKLLGRFCWLFWFRFSAIIHTYVYTEWGYTAYNVGDNHNLINYSVVGIDYAVFGCVWSTSRGM